jgi:hypothetical protein
VHLVPFSIAVVVAVQKNGLKPRQKMDLVIQLTRIFAKAQRHLLKQVIRLVFRPTLFQAQFVYSVGIFFPDRPDPFSGKSTKETRT